MNEAQNWIVQFGDYDLRSINAGFGNTMPAYKGGTTSFFGSSGGIEYYGSAAAPKPPATISLTYIFKASNSTDLQTALDEFMVAHDGSTKRLFYAPGGTYDKIAWRYTYAKPVQISDDRPLESGITHRRQVTYSIADPFWYRPRFSGQVYFDDGVAFDDGESWGVPTIQVLSAGGSFSIYNEGSATALPLLVFHNASGTLGGFVFQRIVSSRAVEEFTYAGTINTTSNQQLIIDCKSGLVSDLSNLTVTPGQQAILSLPPGSSTLKLASASTLTGSPELHVYFDFPYH